MSKDVKGIQMVEVSKLKKAHFNPETRINKIRGLIDSIAELGLIQPILITRDLSIIDGHRRVAAFMKMDLKEIPAIVVEGDPAVVFAHANTTAKKMSGNETLEVYLKEPKAISATFLRRYQEAEEVLTRSLLERMSNEGLSISTYKTAKQLAVLADKETPEVLRKIVRWTLKHSGAGVLSKAMAAGTPVGLLMAAVNNDKPIRQQYAIGGKRKSKTK